MYDHCVRSRDRKKHTGALFFDLSACFDTISAAVLVGKLEIYGFDSRSIKWVQSFLSGRKQLVTIGGEMSEELDTEYGCPQGSCLSPTLFLVLVADIDLWTEVLKNVAFADDTTSVTSGQDAWDVLQDLEVGARDILNFMSANELVANPAKTGFVWFDASGNFRDLKIMVGEEEIKSTSTFRLLGMKIDHNLAWSSHIEELCSALCNRICVLRRLSNSVPRYMLKEFAEGLFTSKL